MSSATVADQSKTVLLFCFLTALCEGIDLQAAGVAAVGISAEFSPTAVQKSWFFSASTIGLTLGALMGGRAADRVGRKLILVWSVAVFGLFSLLTPVAWDMVSLTAARLLTGLGLGGALPNMIALVAESSPENRHKANVALVYSGTPLGGALASMVSMYSGAESWRIVFVLGGVLPLLIALLMNKLIDESAEFKAYKNSLQRADMPKDNHWLAVLDDGRALRSILLWVAFFLGLLTLYLLLNWLPTLLVAVGFSRTQAAAAQIALNIGGFAAALAVGRCMETRWRQASVIATFVALPIMILVLGRITTASSLGYMIGVATLLGCAIVAAQAILYAFAPALYPTAIRGMGVGTAVAVGRVGSIVGPLAVPFLVSGSGVIDAQVLLKLLPIVVICGVSAIALSRLIARPVRG
ncbi:MAG: MFS transporter [Steroidobacteraceae bacterium]